MTSYQSLNFIDPNLVIEVTESTARDLVGRRVLIGDFCRGRRASFSEEQETGRLLVRCGSDFIAGPEVVS